MKKIFYTCLCMVISILFISKPVFATNVDNSKTFSFNLTIDGNETKEVKTGDVITVVLKLHRTDASTSYTMYGMQNEIRYDSTFFEMIEGSEMLSQGVVSTDIAMVDRYREFYMNYLSMSGGTQWDTDMLVGSFQLRVIGESGVTKITNQDYLVSLQDGFGSYACEANELTIILSTDCTVRFMTNGGSEIESQVVQFGEKIIIPEPPVRVGFVFSGWYTDIHLTDEWDFENDVVEGNMSLYAKWDISDTSTDIQDGSEKSQCYLWWLLIILIVLFVIFCIIEKRRKDNKK